MKRKFETSISLYVDLYIYMYKQSNSYLLEYKNCLENCFIFIINFGFYFHFERKYLVKESKLVSVFNSNRPRFFPYLIGNPKQEQEQKLIISFRVAFLNNTDHILFLQKHFIDINEESDCGIIHGHPCELFRVFLNGLSFVLLHLYSSSSFFLLSFVVRLLLVSLLRLIPALCII